MTPWVHGFIPVDQRAPVASPNTTPLLPWQSYPSRGLYACFCATFITLWALYHSWMLGLFPGLQDRAVGCTHGLSDEQVQEQDTYNIIHCKTAFARILIPLFHSACTMVAVSSLTVVTCIIPWACCFVGTTYLHSKGHAAAASAKPNEHAPCTRVRNCCTEFVRFKDPATHARFQGRSIDMETLYEL